MSATDSIFEHQTTTNIPTIGRKSHATSLQSLMRDVRNRKNVDASKVSCRSMWLHCWCGRATTEHHSAVSLISVYLSSTITLTEAFLSTVTHRHQIPFKFHATKENHITWNLASLIFLCNKIKQAQLSQKISHIFCIIAKKKSKVVLFIWKINEHLMFFVRLI